MNPEFVGGLFVLGVDMPHPRPQGGTPCYLHPNGRVSKHDFPTAVGGEWWPDVPASREALGEEATHRAVAVTDNGYVDRQ